MLVAAVWGGAFAAIKYILDYVTPVQLLIFRFVPTTVIALIITLIFYRRDTLAIMRRIWPTLVAISVLWLYGYHLALNVGETVLPAGAAGLIIGTYPIITVFLAAIFVGEKLTTGKIVGGLIAFGGTAFLMIFGALHEGAELNIEPRQWWLYGLIIFVASVSASIQMILAKPLLTGENKAGLKVNPVHLTMLYMVPGLVLILPMLPYGPLPDLGSFETGFWVALWFLIIFCTILAYVGWFWAVERIGAGRVAISTYVIPLFSLVYARIWLGEPIGWPTVVAAGAIVAGVVIANISPKSGE